MYLRSNLAKDCLNLFWKIVVYVFGIIWGFGTKTMLGHGPTNPNLSILSLICVLQLESLIIFIITILFIYLFIIFIVCRYIVVLLLTRINTL